MAPEVSAAIIAGGKSERMGSDKARLVIGGVPLIDRVASVLTNFGPLAIIGGPEDLVALVSKGPVGHVPDMHPGEGPLGGVLTALSQTRASRVIVAACDLARLDTVTVALLVAHSYATDADVTVPLLGGHRQWHVAVWQRRALPTLQQRFANGTRSIRGAVHGLRETVLVTADTSVYFDIDRPEDITSFDQWPSSN